MRKIILSFSVVALSLMVSGMAFGIDIPNISTWTQSMGVGGGGPGRGDVLVASLYDVRNLVNMNTPEGTVVPTTQQTLFAIVNTDTEYGVVGRLRFREWKRSREVLDIDIPLTTNDVWVGEISRKTGGGAILKSPDRWVSATPSTFVTPFVASIFPAEGIEFRTFLIEAAETAPLARTEYGYFEFFGEERVLAPVTTTEPWTFPRLAVGSDRDVKDVLMGTVYLIRPEVAISHQYNMNAISDFAVDPDGIWANTATAFPNFFDDVQGGPGNLGINPGIGGFNQLEAVFSKQFIYFQYATGIDPSDPTLTPMSTSVVVTFFTKHFHYALTSPYALGGVAGGTPFTGLRETLNDHLISTALASSCYVGENVEYRIYDRSENTFDPGAPVSPPPLIPPGKLPYEVNILGLYPMERPPDPPVFRNNLVLATAGAGKTFYTGYANINLSYNGQGESGIVFNFFGNSYTGYSGLPAIGIVMTEFYNDSVQGYYGNTIPWRYAVWWF